MVLRLIKIRIGIKLFIKWGLIFVMLLIQFNSRGISQTTFSKEPVQSITLQNYIRSVSNKLDPNLANQKVLAVLIHFINFGCVACLNEFFDFSDSLQQNITKFGNRNIILMFARDNSDENVQNRIMKGWMKANGLNFPMYLVPRGIFDDYFVDYTTVILINEDDSLEYIEKFPIATQRKKEIIKWLFESK